MRELFPPSPAALHFTFLLLPEFSLLSFASALEPMRAANRAIGHDHYTWLLVSPDGSPVLTSSGISLPVQGPFDPLQVTDALIVLAAFNPEQHASASLLADLRKVGRRGVVVCGIESGPWVLAKAGLLDGCRATTHWEDLDDFATTFPTIDVRPDRFVVDGARVTTGGASPALDMVLYLIRHRQGRSLALEVASMFIYEEVRLGNDPQPLISLGKLERHEPRVAAAIQMMGENIERPVSIREIAGSIGVSERMLELLFNRTVAMSPRGCYLNLRVKAGRRLLVDTRKSITEVAMQSGFGSASAFARRFRSCFGESPAQARKRAMAGYVRRDSPSLADGDDLQSLSVARTKKAGLATRLPHSVNRAEAYLLAASVISVV